MNIVQRVKRAATVAAEAVQRDLEGLPSPEEAIEQARKGVEEKLSDHDRLVRQNKAYFELVASFEKQRDQWRDMFQTQSVENAAAQSYMNEQLEKAASVIAAVVTILNAERRLAGRPLFELDHKLDTGQSVKKRFSELLAELNKGAPVDPGFMKQRDEIAAETAPIDR